MFRQLYEWFGLSTPYGADMREYLAGYDALTGDYSGSNYYIVLGLTMIVVVCSFFSGYYFLLDRNAFRKRRHWFLVLLICMTINFLIGFKIGHSGFSVAAEQGLAMNLMDCAGVGISNMLWSMILFVLLSIPPYPRRFSTSCGFTPWKQ
jgi:hypothetical protein